MASSPIVIIGAARSGTKILRDVLGAGPGARAVPYDVNYVWRYRAEDGPDDPLDPGALTRERTLFIRRTLARMAGIAPGDEDTALIEKTVGNTLRVPFVNAVLPGARFVHLIRDGRDVTESAMRQWQAPPDWRALWTKLRGMPLANAGYVLWFAGNYLRGLGSGRGGGRVWGPRYPGIDADVAEHPLARVCARQWRHSVEWAQRDLAALPPGQVREIRYEDFVDGPEALEGLLDWLDLPDREKVLARYSDSVHKGASGQWRTTLSREDQEVMWDELSAVLDRLGYAA